MLDKVLIYGGSFDPIGLHHLQVAQLALELGPFVQVWFMPACSSPTDKKMTSYEHREQMIRLAIGRNPQYAFCDLEKDLFTLSGQRSYSIDTVKALKSKYKATKINWLIGGDQANQLHNWKSWEELVKITNFVVAPRPYTFAPNSNVEKLKSTLVIPLDKIGQSSSIIRERVQQELSIEYLVPRKVEKYIHKHRLYREA